MVVERGTVVVVSVVVVSRTKPCCAFCLFALSDSTTISSILPVHSRGEMDPSMRSETGALPSATCKGVAESDGELQLDASSAPTQLQQSMQNMPPDLATY